MFSASSIIAAKARKAPKRTAPAPVLAGTPVRPDELGFDEIVFVKRKPY